MCKPASFIVTKSRILWSRKSDSHEDIIRENGLDDGLRGGDFVRVEIVPVSNDYRLPFKEWKFRIDQDSVPGWYDAREVEAAVCAELPRWAEVHIINCPRSKKVVEIEDGMSRVVIAGRVNQSGGKCWASWNARVNQSGGECVAYENARVNQSGGECWAYGDAIIEKIEK